MAEYTPTELMMSACAREVKDGDLVLCGQGLPMAAMVLAKKLYAPNCILMTEAGLVDYDAFAPMLHIADSTCLRGWSYSCDLMDIFTTILNRGYIDVSVLGVGSVDRYGNLNSTVIGDYDHPDIRMTGAGGAPEFLACSKKAILTMRGGKFVKKLDYVTSPGNLGGREERDKSGHFPAQSGPSVLVSTKGVFRFDETGEMYLDALMPGQTVETVRADVPWDLKVAEKVGEVQPPSEEELCFMRKFDLAVSLPRRIMNVIAARQLMAAFAQK
ncbi:MAG: CoA-transferase subunit beta [Bacillota bacterium]